MQPKDSCIGNLRCRWCMQSLMCALAPLPDVRKNSVCAVEVLQASYERLTPACSKADEC